MRVILIVLGFTYFVVGTTLAMIYEHPIVILLCYLIGIMCYGFAGMIGAIEELKREKIND